MKTEYADSRVKAEWTLAPARRFGLRSLLAVLLLLSSPALAEPAFKVGWTRERLSVSAEAAPLADLLGEVARRTGIRLHGAETLGEEVTINFWGLTLREGLRRLLAPVANYVIVEEPFRVGEYRPTLVRFVGAHVAGTIIAPSPEVRDDPESVTANAPDEKPGARLDKFLADADPAVRRWAVERLADVGDEWGFSRLMTALQDENAAVREGAVTALAPYGPQAIKPVTRLLQEETYSAVRVAALQLLANFALPQLAELFHGMLGDSDARVRRAAVEGLIQADALLASEALRTAALDQDGDVRAAALDGLGIYGRDPKRAIEEALVRGDKTTQAIAAELRGTLITSGRWDAVGNEAAPKDATFEGESSLETQSR
jgi:HEAT repeats